MAFLRGGTGVWSTGGTSMTVAIVDLSTVVAGMVVHLETSGLIAGDGYIIATVTPSGTSGGTLTFTSALPTYPGSAKTIAINTLGFNGSGIAYYVAQNVAIQNAIASMLGAGFSADGNSRVLDINKANAGALSEINFKIGGTAQFRVDQVTVSSVEYFRIRRTDDGSTWYNVATIRRDTGAIDLAGSLSMSGGFSGGLPDEAITGPYNFKLSAAVASNALTINVLTAAGATPSTASPVKIPFQAADGTITVRTVSAALSLVVSSGSTLGAVANVPFNLTVAAFDDSGTIRLGVINPVSTTQGMTIEQTGVASSTAEGGAGAADSAQVWYTGSAVTSKSFALLGRLEWSSGLATPGTWGTAPSKQVRAEPNFLVPRRRWKRTVFTSTGTWTKQSWTRLVVSQVIGGGGGGGANAAGPVGSGGGGGGGGYSYKEIANAGATETVTIGAGGAGAGGAGADGSAGGTSSFGSHHSATGGGGGTRGDYGGAGGAPGVGSSGDLNLPGQVGGAGTSSGSWYAGGGCAGGIGGGGGSNGGAAAQGGGGGSGTGNYGTAAARAGGAGFAIVDEFE